MAGDIYFKLISEKKEDTISIESEQILVSELKKLIGQKLGHKEEIGIYHDQQQQQEYQDDQKIQVNKQVYVERKQNDPLGITGKYLQCQKCKAPNPQKTTCCKRYICKVCKEKSKKTGKCIFCENNNLQTEKQIQLKNENLKKIKETHNFPSQQDFEQILDNSKYFMIKSCNQDNINVALQHSIWATTFKNQKILNDAFVNNPNMNIILIFGVNKQPNFQGVAKMESIPGVQGNIGNNKQPSYWKNLGEKIKLGGDFKIKWLRVEELPHSLCQDLINQRNKEHISRQRDCQEIDGQTGKALCMKFQYQENRKSSSQDMVTDRQKYFNHDDKTQSKKNNFEIETEKQESNNDEEYAQKNFELEQFEVLHISDFVSKYNRKMHFSEQDFLDVLKLQIIQEEQMETSDSQDKKEYDSMQQQSQNDQSQSQSQSQQQQFEDEQENQKQQDDEDNQENKDEEENEQDQQQDEENNQLDKQDKRTVRSDSLSDISRNDNEEDKQGHTPSNQNITSNTNLPNSVLGQNPMNPQLGLQQMLTLGNHIPPMFPMQPNYFPYNPMLVNQLNLYYPQNKGLNLLQHNYNPMQMNMLQNFNMGGIHQLQYEENSRRNRKSEERKDKKSRNRSRSRDSRKKKDNKKEERRKSSSKYKKRRSSTPKKNYKYKY